MTLVESIAAEVTREIADSYQYFSQPQRDAIKSLIVRRFEPHMPSPQSSFNFTDYQLSNLGRVKTRLGTEILLFCKDRMYQKRCEFHMDDLRKHLAQSGIVFAPASPDRILRHLRTLKVLDYRVVNRQQSLYEVISTVFSKGQ